MGYGEHVSHAELMVMQHKPT